MAIPAPRTWVDRDSINTTNQNTDRDAILYAQKPTAVIADRVAAQSILNNTTTLVSFDTEIFDSGAGFAPTSSTVTFAEAGVYVITAGGTWAANATGARVGTIRHNGNDVNGGTWEAPALGGGAPTFMSHCATVLAAAGDTAGYAVTQTSGGSLNISAVRFSITRASGT